jgi:hypothetical protein
MQRSNSQRVTAIKFHSQATLCLPGQGAGAVSPASNDETYLQEETGLKFMLSVLANVIGGAALLAAMFNMPIILAVIWGI